MTKLSRHIPMTPMFATLGTKADASGADWSIEMKWDGVRAICEISGAEVRLWSRNGNDITASFPEMTAALPSAFPCEHCIVDGEIVAFDEAGRPNFGRLQSRLGLVSSAASAASEEVPAHLLVFDLLSHDGTDLMQAAYRERRELLEQLVESNSVVHVPPVFEGRLDAAMASSLEHGLEGVVAKRPDSPYRAGRRTAEWIKIKHSRMQEVVVVGWQDGKGRRANGVGSLLLAVNSDEGLRFVGKVGTGFSDADLTKMKDTFSRMKRMRAPVQGTPAAIARAAHWITPRLVGEVQFGEWTTSGHLRHPVWRGWRPDKDAMTVRIEEQRS